MSPRVNRRDPGRHREPAGRVEDAAEVDAADGDWVVRQVTGAASTKAYRCPGCDQEIAIATPHVVAWSAYDVEAGDRRHWHAACWSARGRRTVKVHRSKNAPRHG